MITLCVDKLRFLLAIFDDKLKCSSWVEIQMCQSIMHALLRAEDIGVLHLGSVGTGAALLSHSALVLPARSRSCCLPQRTRRWSPRPPPAFITTATTRGPTLLVIAMAAMSTTACTPTSRFLKATLSIYDFIAFSTVALATKPILTFCYFNTRLLFTFHSVSVSKIIRVSFWV